MKTNPLITVPNIEPKNNNRIYIPIYMEDGFTLPKYAYDDDACLDIYAKSIEHKDDNIIIHTGIHVELPIDYEMVIRPRSNLVKTEFYMPNTPGTVDAGYRGEVLVIYKNRTSSKLIDILSKMTNIIRVLNYSTDAADIYGFGDINDNVDILYKSVEEFTKDQIFPYKEGDRIGQLLIRHREKVIWDIKSSLNELSKSNRDTKGFGSTGK